jgi:predicted ATPase
MKAVLDWSYGLLTEAEQKVLQRAAIFTGSFTMHAASAVIADESLAESEVFENLSTLVAKSLISSDLNEAEPRMRLLETTRAYALSKLMESGEGETLGQRYTEYNRDFLEYAGNNEISKVLLT